LIRWDKRADGPHEIKVRVFILGMQGSETLTRRCGNLRHAQRVARALAKSLGVTVRKIDMREAARDSQRQRARLGGMSI